MAYDAELRSELVENDQHGFYEVFLDDYGIKAELTTSERVGFHRYTFPKSGESHIILDLMSNIYNYDSKNVWTFVRVEDNQTVVGYRETTGWARTKKVFFAMKFSTDALEPLLNLTSTVMNF